MPNNILFVFEGERTEKQITDNLTKYFISNDENTVIQCAFCNNIYKLHKVIAQDEDLDTFALLKEIPQNVKNLAPYKRDDFAEIYMFFDYDGHDSSATDDKVKEVLTFFDEETAAGKLYLSYPMVEALKHIPSIADFINLKVTAKENIRYKEVVNDETESLLRQIKKYTREVWIDLIELHLKKMNFIARDVYSLPTSAIPQIDVFLKQLEKYINVDSTVAVLSSFPVFLFDYYGHKTISSILLSEK